MKLKSFFRALRSASPSMVVVSGLLMSAAANAQPVDYVLGRHYVELAQPLPDTDADRIDITELFSYGCPTCFDLLPTLQIWESSYRTSDVNFSRVPVVWNDVMETHARLFFAADSLGLIPAQSKSSWEVTRTIHNAIYESVHSDNQPLRSPNEVAALLGDAGLTSELLDGAWSSSGVEASLAQAKSISSAPELASLPGLLVDGRYLVTLNAAVPTTEDLFKVLNFIVVKIREEQRAARR